MKAQDKKLWDNFVVYFREHHGQILKPVAPLGVWMNQETIGALRNRIQRLSELDRELQAFSQIQQNLAEEVDAEAEQRPLLNKLQPKLSSASLEAKSQELSSRLNRYDTDPEMASMRATRAELPLNVHSEEVKTLFSNNDVCILVGATGSGKTTQVPQFLLDQYIREGRGAECNIICTQPRRIAAISVAERVAAERGERLQQSVGYRVRFNSAAPEWGGSITYCTTGIFLRQLQDGWENLRGVSHVIVDEVHERNVEIDFLMVILKRLLEARRRGDESAPPIKVILMSATIDTTLFRKYFGAAFDSGECPYIEIPGRMFPVEKFYLDDIQTIVGQHPTAVEVFRNKDVKNYIDHEMDARRDIASALQEEEAEAVDKGIDWSRTGSHWEEEGLEAGSGESQPDLLIANLIAHLCLKKGDGAVLVFLPGFREIVNLNNLLTSTRFLGENFNNSSKYRLFMLHSSIPTMQQDVFTPLAPGVRKIILSTNIAETSVTIPEVAFVIDTCKHRENRYSQTRRSTSLVCTWISQSSARQRMGRAGRIKPGEYYALCYAERHNAFPGGNVPEIKRSDLQGICLMVRAYGIHDPIPEVLEECIEPPSSLAVLSALKRLRNLGALDENEKLTALGQILAQLYFSLFALLILVLWSRRWLKWSFSVHCLNVSTLSSSSQQSNPIDLSS
jgi:ATP-dependent RNA helicase DHX36